MEDFGARDRESDEFCQARVRECDLFVGIVGLLYGSEHVSGKSFTEREYDVAVAAGKPRLMFLAPEDFPVPGTLIENDAKRERQRSFRARVDQERIRDTFSSPAELATKVVQAIRNWERDTGAAIPPAKDSSPRSAPLAPYFAHPYPLQANFTGRLDQRRLLTDWILDDSRPMLGLIAIGGMGKSSLVWAWVQKDVLGHEVPGMLPADEANIAIPEERRPVGILWWSFYEQEARFSAFLKDALVYLSRGQVQPEEIPSQHERVRALLSILRQENFLLVLDGFERELRGALEDDEFDDGQEQETTDVRLVLDLNAANFLKWAAAGPLKSRILFTSRLFPRDLDGVAGCRRETLDGLDEEEVVRFFASQGIRGTRAEIHAVTSPYGYHPLALRLVSGMILHDIRSPGDVKVALEYDPLPELVPRRHHVLAWALNAASIQSRELLSRISALRSAADFETTLAVTPETSLADLQHQIRELIDRNLLVQDPNGRFDMHSVVRRYAYKQLVRREETHHRLAAHFHTIPKEAAPAQLDEAKPWMELAHHQTRSGDVRNAYTTYVRHLRDLFYKIGAFHSSVELLNDLVENMRDETQMRPEERRGILDSLAINYGLLGMPRLAVRILSDASQIRGGGPKFRTVANLVAGYTDLGQLRRAEQEGHRLVELAQPDRWPIQHLHGCTLLSFVSCFLGDYAKAGFYLAKAARLPLVRPANEHRVWLSLFSIMRLVSMGTVADALPLLKRALDIQERLGLPEERDAVLFDYFHGKILVALLESDPSKDVDRLKDAERCLTGALARCRRIQLVNTEALILVELAKWTQARSDVANARDYALEGLRVADRSELRLQQAEIRNFLAELEHTAGNRSLAEEHALVARERATCDGPPYYYKHAYETAEVLLERMGRTTVT